jgi:hypothetical protein
MAGKPHNSAGPRSGPGIDLPQTGAGAARYIFGKAIKEPDMDTTVETPALAISPEKVAFFIAKAHQFDVKDAVSDPDSGSNSADDMMLDVLEDHADDPTQRELTAFINALTEDEQVDLVALMWLGRGDGDLVEWDELREEARRLHNNRTAQYLLGKPMLGDHLEEGLASFGINVES